MTEKAELVDAGEMARLLGVPKSWVYGQTANGSIPHAKLGHYVRFDVPTVLAWAGRAADRSGRGV